MNKLVITCAITGAEVTKKDNPAVPYTVAEVAESAYGAYKAGASIIHLHAREDDGTPTQDWHRYKEQIDAIKTRCPGIIIQVSTGGSVGMSAEERMSPLEISPEMASLDCGTINFGKNDIFINTVSDIELFAAKMHEKGVQYELGIFEKGHVDTALRLWKKGLLRDPLRFCFALGVYGAMTGEPRDFQFLKDSIPEDAMFSVAGVGKYEYILAEQAIIHGGNVRVGLEDNLYVEKGVLASSNAALVEKAVWMSHQHGRDIATPEEARKILKLEKTR